MNFPQENNNNTNVIPTNTVADPCYLYSRSLNVEEEGRVEARRIQPRKADAIFQFVSTPPQSPKGKTSCIQHHPDKVQSCKSLNSSKDYSPQQPFCRWVDRSATRDKCLSLSFRQRSIHKATEHDKGECAKRKRTVQFNLEKNITIVYNERHGKQGGLIKWTSSKNQELCRWGEDLSSKGNTQSPSLAMPSLPSRPSSPTAAAAAVDVPKTKLREKLECFFWTRIPLLDMSSIALAA